MWWGNVLIHIRWIDLPADSEKETKVVDVKECNLTAGVATENGYCHSGKIAFNDNLRVHCDSRYTIIPDCSQHNCRAARCRYRPSSKPTLPPPCVCAPSALVPFDHNIIVEQLGAFSDLHRSLLSVVCDVVFSQESRWFSLILANEVAAWRQRWFRLPSVVKYILTFPLY